MQPCGQLAPRVLNILHHGTSSVLLVYYIGVMIIQAYHGRKHQQQSRRALPLWQRRSFIGLNFAVTSCYVAQAVHFVLELTTEPDGPLINSISQILFWGSISLISVSATSFPLFIYAGLTALALLLETTICALSFGGQTAPSLARSPSFWAFRFVTLSVLTVYVLFCVCKLSEIGPGSLQHEGQSLLKSNSDWSSATSSSSYGTRCIDENSESEGDEDDDSDDEDELLQAHETRLAQKGGWIQYLVSFHVFLPYLVPLRDRRLQCYVVLLLFNSMLQRALYVLHPRQLGIIIDKLTTEHVIPWKDILWWIVLETAASNSAGVGGVNEFLENRLAAWSKQELKVASFKHVMGLSMDFHDKKDSGEIIKAIEQAESLHSLLRILVLEIGPGAADVLIAMWFVTFLFDVYAMFIVIAVGIAFVFVTYHITAVATVARRLASGKERHESKIVYESVGNWFTISSFNRQEYTISRLSHVVRDATRAARWNDDLYTYVFAAQEVCEHAGRLAISLLAAHRIVLGTSTVGDFIAVETYWDTITTPLYILSHSYRELNSDLVDAERLLQLFSQKPTITDRASARPIGPIQGTVSVEGLAFAYEGRNATLQDFNVLAQPGQTIALVGQTGGGKSTLLKLLMRHHDITAGQIKIDGTDIRDVTLESLRECFGYVPQDPIMFNLSILDNVRYGRLTASDEEVYEACKAASIHDKIQALPAGYASKVGERGVKLSGGERQRIAIARVFLKTPEIVLLDEATSAMDSQTEAKIQAALRHLTRGRTTFVIAHRLSTIVEADKILVVDGGQVIESGTHDELLALQGQYLELWTKQALGPIM